MPFSVFQFGWFAFFASHLFSNYFFCRMAINEIMNGVKPPEGDFVVWQLSSCHAKVCAYFCKMEKSFAFEKIGSLTRAHVAQVCIFFFL